MKPQSPIQENLHVLFQIAEIVDVDVQLQQIISHSHELIERAVIS